MNYKGNKHDSKEVKIRQIKKCYEEKLTDASFINIEVFYNRQRVQKRLGYLSPVQFLNTCDATALPFSA